jgi:hypothetical protein
MFRRGILFSTTSALILASVALACPGLASAQRRGGGGPAGGGGLGNIGRPSGVDEKDSLKDFHQAMAVQATGQQIAEFRLLVKSTGAAKAELDAFLAARAKSAPSASVSGGSAVPAANAGLNQSLETARSANKKFVTGFSETQKSGLKEITRKLERADSDLDQENRKLGVIAQTAQAPGAGGTSIGDGLSKALDDFSNQQLALGREMGITLASGEDLSFTLPAVKSPTHIGRQPVAVSVSGDLTQVSAQSAQRIFKLELLADLPDLQQNITAIMRGQLDSSGRCGERVAVRQAMLTPATPASLLVLLLHYERWTCAPGSGTASELAESDGKVEMKLTPAVDKSGALKLATEYSRIDASGAMGDSLRTGFLGDDLRDKVSEALSAPLRAGADFKTTLPPAVQNFATLQNVRFQNAGAGDLEIALEGQIQISDEQANLLANQLNQALSARETPAPPPAQ